MSAHVGRHEPAGPLPGRTATVLQLEADVALLHVELGGDDFSESLFGIDEPLALLRVIVEGGDPEDPSLAFLCDLGPERLHLPEPDTQL